MAEGFLKLENDLEGEAEKCLQVLVDRCLVLVCKKSLDGTKIRSCKVHDLIYDLCLREIQRENIFIMNDIVLGESDSGWLYLSSRKMQPFKCVTDEKIDNYCPNGLYRALLTHVHHQLRDHDHNDHLKRTRAIFSFHLEDSYHILKSELTHFKLLNPHLVEVPIIALPCVFLPCVFRHTSRKFAVLDNGRHLGFSKLQTISYLSPRCCTKEVITGIQNVKELGICGHEPGYGHSIQGSGPLNNLVHLQQLETLSFIFYFPHFPASAKVFPATLKKLKLRLTHLRWSDLDIIAELPNLEVLKLMYGACLGNKWYPKVRGFTQLKIFLIGDRFLEYWKATDDNFPVLVLKECRYLKEIPIEFAEIHTLQLIELSRCLPELGESAARIQQEQEELGNNPVEVHISDSSI
ncbi:hypothetical protein P3S67_008496 [Capsicum chacoense]